MIAHLDVHFSQECHLNALRFTCDASRKRKR